MFSLLALRNFLHKPWRSALLFFGFGLGVSVMIILLSIGDAMVVQSEQERLVGGGSITVLPEGIDIEVMKTGGLGGLFFSIANARFLNLQLLGAPRLAPFVRAVAPQIDEQLVYLRTGDGVERPVRASADIPSEQRAVGAAPALAAGQWVDDSADRRWGGRGGGRAGGGRARERHRSLSYAASRRGRRRDVGRVALFQPRIAR